MKIGIKKSVRNLKRETAAFDQKAKMCKEK